MSLSNLTWSGWLLFVLTCLSAIAFLRNVVLMVSLKSDAARIEVAKHFGFATLILIVEVLWLSWLVSP